MIEQFERRKKHVPHPRPICTLLNGPKIGGGRHEEEEETLQEVPKNHDTKRFSPTQSPFSRWTQSVLFSLSHLKENTFEPSSKLSQPPVLPGVHWTRKLKIWIFISCPYALGHKGEAPVRFLEARGSLVHLR